MENDAALPLVAILPLSALKRWLPKIFPEGTAHRNFVVREMAAKVIFVMLYTSSIEGTGRWFRPAQATLMTDRQAGSSAEAQRRKWTQDSLTAGRLKHSSRSWYAPNSREPIRDETLRSGLIPLGAVVERAGVPTTSSAPRYALAHDFYDLLVALHDGADTSCIENWRAAHLSAEALARVNLLKTGTAAGAEGARITIHFPNGESRLMLTSPSANITKAVVERFAPKFLERPAVLFLSDSGEKVVARDEQLARRLGLHIETDRNLPDVILVDVGSSGTRLIFVEVVATDGAITAQRKQALADLAAAAKFSPTSVHFITAFADRGSPAFRKVASEIAWDSFAWFASEPDHLVHYHANAWLHVAALTPKNAPSG